MQECIICRTTKSEFSDEHVIPDSLGGYFHISSVCKDCNSKMGTSVDSKLLAHLPVKMIRQQLALKGKSGRIPNPFEGVHTLVSDPARRVRVEIIDNEIVPFLLPKVVTEEMPDGSQRISVNVDSRDKKTATQIANEILARKGLAAIDKGKIREIGNELHQPEVQANVKIDLLQFKIGLLKIGYEFAVTTVESYYNDPHSVQISKILQVADYMAAGNLVNTDGESVKSLLSPFSEYLDLGPSKHHLILLGDGKCFYCVISVSNLLFACIKLSSDFSFTNDALICSNDILGKSFSIAKFSEIVNESNEFYLRFKFLFKDEQEASNFEIHQNDAGFDYYRENNRVVLFNSKGEKLRLTADDLVNEFCKSFDLKDVSDIPNPIIVPVDGEYYIRLLPSDKLVRISEVLDGFTVSKRI